MAFVITQEIQGNECIGDSRIKINNNFDKLDTIVVTLSTNTISTSATDTILHTYTPTIRRLASNVRDNSIQAKHLQTDSVTTTKLSAQAVTNAKIAFDGGSLGFRNKIINGGFDIWQRGTNFTTPAHLSYVADRWLFLKFTGNASSVSRGGFTVGQTDVPDTPKYYLRTTVSAAGDVCIGQRIEGVETLAGKTATYSFWIRAQSNTTLNQVVFEQMFGTGGGGSAIVNFNGSVNTPVTTNWTKITGTVNVPNINGKTKGVNPDDYLSIRIDIDEAYTGWFDIAQVQLEEGPVATPFEQRPIGLELSLCQRYYEKSYAMDVAPRTITNGGAVIQRFGYVDTVNGDYYTVIFRTEKRISSPSISLISRTNGALGVWTDGSTSGFPNITALVAPNFTNSKSFGVNIRFIPSSFTSVEGHWTADAEL